MNMNTELEIAHTFDERNTVMLTSCDKTIGVNSVIGARQITRRLLTRGVASYVTLLTDSR